MEVGPGAEKEVGGEAQRVFRARGAASRSAHRNPDRGESARPADPVVDAAEEELPAPVAVQVDRADETVVTGAGEDQARLLAIGFDEHVVARVVGHLTEVHHHLVVAIVFEVERVDRGAVGVRKAVEEPVAGGQEEALDRLPALRIEQVEKRIALAHGLADGSEDGGQELAVAGRADADEIPGMRDRLAPPEGPAGDIDRAHPPNALRQEVRVARELPLAEPPARAEDRRARRRRASPRGGSGAGRACGRWPSGSRGRRVRRRPTDSGCRGSRSSRRRTTAASQGGVPGRSSARSGVASWRRRSRSDPSDDWVTNGSRPAIISNSTTPSE